ncbi:MAG: PCRF domain-containing protein, partial [Candidatus Moranbacteria bacterium]|nr:PCRF domain-containing protein [Candidatus Moranbacteria bacterium]
MINQIKNIKKEYLELQNQLNSPEMINNPSQMASLGKRQSELEKIMFFINRLDSIEVEMRENGEIINSQEDAEMTAMAIEANTQLSQEQ